MCQRPSACWRDQCGASQAALSGVSSGLFLQQPLGHRLQAVVAAQRLRRLQLVQPLRQPARRLVAAWSRACRSLPGSPGGARAQAARRRSSSPRCRPCCGPAGRPVGPRRRARHRAVRRGRPGSRGTSRCRPPGAAREPEAAPVGRDRPSARAVGGGQRVDHELERRADIHPAVQQHQRRPRGRGQRGVAPGVEVILQAADGDEATVRRTLGQVSHARHFSACPRRHRSRFQPTIR